MSAARIYSKEDLAQIPWPESADGQYARDYLGPFLEHGTERYIRNTRQTELRVALAGGAVFPLSETRYHPQNAYTCSPYNHYISYGVFEEIQRLKNPALEKVIQVLLLPVAAYFRASQFDRVVYVNNWLLSTNLYPALQEGMLDGLLAALRERYADRTIVFRSVDGLRNPFLLRSLQNAGCRMVLSRQVWYMEPEQALRTRQCKEDRRVLRGQPYQVVANEELDDADLSRMLELYNQLYVGKYSAYNPQFTLDFFRLARERGLLQLRALRAEGRIDAAMGFFERNGLMTQPVFGYDLALPQENGLYRLLTLLTLQEGRERGLSVHASAGVGKFKKIRGGKSAIEYHAVYDRHLPARARVPWAVMKWIVDRAIPIFQKNDF